MQAGEESRSDLAVLEANEHKQRRRLQEVLDAHRAVENTADKLFEMYAEGTVSADARNIGIQHAVKRFIRESHNLLSDWDEEESDDEVPHPWETEIGAIPMQSRRDINVVGLDEFLATQETYTESWTTYNQPKHGPKKQVRHRDQHTVPKTVSWDAYMLLWEFLNAEYDVDVQFEEMDDSLPTWGFEEVDDPDIEDTADLARERMASEDDENTEENDGE